MEFSLTAMFFFFPLDILKNLLVKILETKMCHQMMEKFRIVHQKLECNEFTGTR